jgi:hypothetical protein
MLLCYASQVVRLLILLPGSSAENFPGLDSLKAGSLISLGNKAEQEFPNEEKAAFST